MATTNNIGLYCFDTGNEDAKTSLEALFGAGNSNMKKIDDAIGELRKKSFIVNTEAELNALLTEENLGKTVSFNGALYIITEGGSSIIEGETLDKIYFDTSIENPDLSKLTYHTDGDAIGTAGILQNEDGGFIVAVLNTSLIPDFASNAYVIMAGEGNFVYASEDVEALGISKGWNTGLLQSDGAFVFDEGQTIATVDQQDLWSAFISKESFGESTGDGIIAKPVGAEGGGLPSFAPEDAGKFLRVDSNGNIVAEAIAYAEGESF